jgi:fatty acid-binding protein DegV
MGTVKKNPNEIQIKEAKSTRPKSIEKLKAKLNQEIQKNKPKNLVANKDEGAADEEPFDARSNNMHQKR